MADRGAHLILYVRDPGRARAFYRALLGEDPVLDVPGMTEFELSPKTWLGLMPSQGIRRLLGDVLPDPDAGHGVPRAEVYLRVRDPDAWYARALELGAKALSPAEPRDWGDRVAYCLDLDGHVLAFAGALEVNAPSA